MWMNFIEKIVDPVTMFAENWLRARPVRRWLAERRFVKVIEGEITEEFLQLLFHLIGLCLFLDKKFRRNIEGFKGKYVFEDKARDFTVSATFDKGRLKVSEKDMSNPDVKIVFKDEAALFRFMLSGKPDVISAILNQEVKLEGNLNYFYKFAYMAMHLKLSLTGS